MAFPISPIDGQMYNGYKYNAVNAAWENYVIPYGLDISYPASSAQEIISASGDQESGTYYIQTQEALQLYCDMDILGGGWMSFASAPSSGAWFGGNSSGAWDGLSYSYGTYSSNGAIGNYWRDYSKHNVSELLFVTGNGDYWVSFPISYIVENSSASVHTSGVTTSNNFPSDGNNYNGSITIFHRPGLAEDPWINVGNSHAVGNNYMFWGENSYSTHNDFKNANGGIMIFVR